VFEAVFQAASPAPLPAPDARMRPIVADVAGKVSHVKVVRPTGVDKGAQGAQAPQSPGKNFFQLKQWDFQASLQLNPVVHVTIT